MTIGLRVRSGPALLLGVLSATALAAACSGGGSGGGGTGNGELGGYVILSHTNQVATTFGFFVNSSGLLSSSFDPALDTCSTPAPPPTPDPSATPPPNPVYFDGGPTLTLTGGGKTIALTRQATTGYIYYALNSVVPSDIADDAVYAVALDGGPDLPATSFSGALQIRHPITLPANEPIPASGPLALTWTGVGADFIRFDFFSGLSIVLTCYAKDDGAFSVPESDLSTLPAGNGNTLAATAESFHKAPLDGRVVVFEGAAVSGSTWSK